MFVDMWMIALAAFSLALYLYDSQKAIQELKQEVESLEEIIDRLES